MKCQSLFVAFLLGFPSETSLAYEDGMEDEDEDDSLNGALKDKESGIHGVSIPLSDLIDNLISLLVMCAKCPPEDYEPDTDDMAGEGHQGGTPQAIKQTI